MNRTYVIFIFNNSVETSSSSLDASNIQVILLFFPDLASCPSHLTNMGLDKSAPEAACHTVTRSGAGVLSDTFTSFESKSYDILDLT